MHKHAHIQCVYTQPAYTYIHQFDDLFPDNAKEIYMILVHGNGFDERVFFFLFFFFSTEQTTVSFVEKRVAFSIIEVKKKRERSISRQLYKQLIPNRWLTSVNTSLPLPSYDVTFTVYFRVHVLLSTQCIEMIFFYVTTIFVLATNVAHLWGNS